MEYVNLAKLKATKKVNQGKKIIRSYFEKELNVKSLKAIKEHYEVYDNIYDYLGDIYNDIYVGEQRNKTNLKKEYRQYNDNQKKLLLNTGADPIPISRKPEISNEKRFGATFTEKTYINPNNSKVGIESADVVNFAIPDLRSKVKELRNISVIVVFQIELYQPITDKYDKHFVSLKRKIIYNMDEIIPFIQDVKQDFSDRLPNLDIVGSGWVLSKVLNVNVSITKYKPIKASSYIELDAYITNKKCCINIQNADDKCFLYCILYHFNKDKILKNPQRVSSYNNFLNQFDFKSVEYPVKINAISKIENIIDYGINVWGYDKEHSKIPFLLHKSKRQDDKIINLLYITEFINKTMKSHYVYIKNLNTILKQNDRDENGKHVSKEGHFCVNCIKQFVSRENLKKHKLNGCDEFEPQKIVLPEIKDGKIPKILFRNYNNKIKAPVVIYADFETLLEPYVDKKENNQCQKINHLPPCGFSFNVVSDYPELNLGMTLYRGENTAENFINKILKIQDTIEGIIKKTNKKMIITPEQEVEFLKCKVCHICEKSIKPNEVKVRDHDHLNGLYRGCACNKCNINLNDRYFKTPVYFHNLKGFDGHLIIQGLKKKNFDNIRLIAQNFEKYMKIEFANLVILDSFAFLSSSLDSLSSNLNPYLYKKCDDDDKEKQKILKHLQIEMEKRDVDKLRVIYKHTSTHFKDNEKFLKVIKKGVYPYEYMDSLERFNETELPPIEKFYSSLSDSNISIDDYKHAKETWELFNIQNMGEYHDLYLKTDVLLLTDVFETFRNTSMKSYKLDPSSGYITLPSYSWDCRAYMSKDELEQLEQLTDIDMYIFFERGVRGGISMITHRYARANNKYMKDYDKNIESSYIQYLDANNLYGGAMCEKLPYGGFNWVEDVKIRDISNFNSDGDIGYVLEVDLEYPEELHDKHNNYPLAPESKCIMKKDLSPYQLNQLDRYNESHNENIKKLVPNLNNKTNYVCHIKNLQYYMSKGLKLTKIHKVLKFKQKAWLKEYIDFNTKLRKDAKNDFEKDFYKLMNNAVFGKCLENVRSRVDIQLYTDEEKALFQVAKPQYVNHKTYSETLIAIQQLQKSVKLNKPVYAGMAILDLSKLIMYEFHYDYILPKYGNKATLLFTDTDSLCYKIETEDLYKDNYENKDRFDMGQYKFDDKYRRCDTTNDKTVGKMKDETKGVPIREFVGIRAKCYSCLLDNEYEKKVCKGIGKQLIKRNVITHKNYLDCIKPSYYPAGVMDERQMATFNSLRTFNHEIYVYKNVKVGLSASNDKQYLLADGIHSLSYGHYKIPK